MTRPFRLLTLLAVVVLALERVRLVGGVLVGGAEHGAGAGLHEPPVRALEHGRLADARLAPRGPEVQDDDLALVVGDRRRAAAVQQRALEVLAGRRGEVAGLDGVVERRVVTAVDDAVDQQPDERRGEQADDDRDDRTTARGGHGAQGIATSFALALCPDR